MYGLLTTKERTTPLTRIYGRTYLLKARQSRIMSCVTNSLPHASTYTLRETSLAIRKNTGITPLTSSNVRLEAALGIGRTKVLTNLEKCWIATTLGVVLATALMITTPAAMDRRYLIAEPSSSHGKRKRHINTRSPKKRERITRDHVTTTYLRTRATLIRATLLLKMGRSPWKRSLDRSMVSWANIA